MVFRRENWRLGRSSSKNKKKTIEKKEGKKEIEYRYIHGHGVDRIGKRKKRRTSSSICHRQQVVTHNNKTNYCVRDLQSFSIGVGGDLATAAAI
jgi:hypothetical protein